MAVAIDFTPVLTTAPTLSRNEGQSIIFNNQIKIKVLEKRLDNTVILEIVHPKDVSVTGENLKVGRVHKNRFQAAYESPITITDRNTGNIIAVITPIEEVRNRIRIQTQANKSLIVDREEVSEGVLEEGITEHEVAIKGHELHELLRLKPWQRSYWMSGKK